MVPVENLNEYRSFLEYRLLTALQSRSIEYEADVTRILTEAIADLGRHRKFQVTLEKRYHTVPEGTSHRSDVHWDGEVGHIWEIDRSLKYRSVNKLMGAKEPEKMWVLWAKDAELSVLRLLDVQGINILILSPDVRKLVWDRLMNEAFQRKEVHFLMRHQGRFDQAMELDERMQREPPSGLRPA
jgi:hypothetical protein